jgi:hypothetical protein
MALVKQGVITWNEKADEGFELRVKKSSKKYVPDVMFSMKGPYGALLIQKADPVFPLDFFVIKIREGFPKNPKPTFARYGFPTENRTREGSWARVKEAVEAAGLTSALRDFHLLFWVYTRLAQPQKALLFPVQEAPLRAALETFWRTANPNPSPSPNPLPKSLPAVNPNPNPNPNPSQAHIRTQLQGMGFTEAQIHEALFVTNGTSFDAALEYLISTR